MSSLLARLCVVYGQPDSPDPAAYLAEISRLIDRGNYTGTELEKAGDRVLANHRGRMFPTPAEIMTACAETRAAKTERVPDSKLDPQWLAPAFATADMLIKTPMGRVAAREGWILSLHDFIRKTGRLPEQSEVGRVKAWARGFDDAYAAVCRGEGGMCSAALRRLGDTFLAKRDKYAAMTGEAASGE